MSIPYPDATPKSVPSPSQPVDPPPLNLACAAACWTATEPRSFCTQASVFAWTCKPLCPVEHVPARAAARACMRPLRQSEQRTLECPVRQGKGVEPSPDKQGRTGSLLPYATQTDASPPLAAPCAGVRLRSNLEAGPLPPAEHDLGMVWVETQLAAVPEDPDDDLLIRWRKIESPFLHLPPSHLQLTGWRDPFVFTTNTAAAPSEPPPVVSGLQSRRAACRAAAVLWHPGPGPASRGNASLRCRFPRSGRAHQPPAANLQPPSLPSPPPSTRPPPPRAHRVPPPHPHPMQPSLLASRPTGTRATSACSSAAG
jgi:hypothetical protein